MYSLHASSLDKLTPLDVELVSSSSSLGGCYRHCFVGDNAL